MDALEFLLVLALLAATVWVISAPLRAARTTEPQASSDVAELQAAKEAKYREIRDAELDFRTGKLSEEDYRAVERALRAEAVEILKRLDRASDDQTPSG